MARVEEILHRPQHPDQISIADPTSPLLHAAANGHVEVVRVLLEAGASPNMVSESPVHEESMTPLGMVVILGLVDVARLLLESRANTEQVFASDSYYVRGEYRQSIGCLHAAAQGGCVPLVELLLEARADARRVAGNSNETPLQRAEAKGNAEVAAVLRGFEQVLLHPLPANKWGMFV